MKTSKCNSCGVVRPSDAENWARGTCPACIKCNTCGIVRPPGSKWHGRKCPKCKAAYQRERSAKKKADRPPPSRRPGITFQEWKDIALARHAKEGKVTGWGAKPKRKRFLNEHEWKLAFEFQHEHYQEGASHVRSRNVAKKRWANGEIKARNLRNGTGKETRICQHSGCSVQASFGVDGERTFCLKHKDEHMEHLPALKCEHEGCNTQRTFGIKGEGARVCAEHARGIEGYVDINKPVCVVDGCTVRPYYARIGDTHPTHCATHGKALGYVDVKTKKCEHPGCTLNASFAEDGKPRTFCQAHAHVGMVNVKEAKCIDDGCTLPAMWGVSGERAQWCSRHKVHHAGVLYKPRRVCEVEGCRQHATHGKYRQNIRCLQHARSDDICTIEFECDACHLIDLLNDQHVCEHCDPVFRLSARGYEQRRIKHLFDLNHVDYMPEKTVGGSKLMPDFLVRSGEHLIAIEVDEHQHAHSSYPDEVGRMRAIAEANRRICMFIRYNPDEYRGALTNAPQQERHDMLLRVIGAYRKDDHAGRVAVVQLYYDGFSEPLYDYI